MLHAQKVHAGIYYILIGPKCIPYTYAAPLGYWAGAGSLAIFWPRLMPKLVAPVLLLTLWAVLRLESSRPPGGGGGEMGLGFKAQGGSGFYEGILLGTPNREPQEYTVVGI